MRTTSFFSSIRRHDIPNQMLQVKALKGLVFETVHKRKDGSTFPVEVSSQLIELDGHGAFLPSAGIRSWT
jgi:hypothetical protein